MNLNFSALIWLLLPVAMLCASCQQMSRQPEGQACDVTLRLRLSDTPGPAGHALAYTPWKIAHGEEPDSLDIAEDHVLAQGETDDSGSINISEKDQDRVNAAVCGEKPMWLVYPGQTVRIVVKEQSPEWSENEELFYLLRSQGFFEGVSEYSEFFFDTEAGLSGLDVARQAYDVESDSDLLKKLRGLQRK